ncbi:MAG TPA: alpha/beta fold hydrolase, partial [Candidatus Limnocylindrales bacterium]
MGRPAAPPVRPFPDRPSRFVTPADGTPIALFSSGEAAGGTRPLLLVHGTSGDHRTWRVVGPMLGQRRCLTAMDRRGRGDSGDATAWSIEREIEDVAAVADALAASSGWPVDVAGHSLGGRLALAAAASTPSIRRVVAYESAPGRAEVDPALVAR